MHGWALVILFGIPSLLAGLWFGNIAFQGHCLAYLIGPIQCGPTIYIHTFIGVMFFMATLFLAYIWK